MSASHQRTHESIYEWMRSRWRLLTASVKGNSVRSAIYSPDGHRGRHVSYRPLRVYQSGRGNQSREGSTRKISIGDAIDGVLEWRTRAAWPKPTQLASSASQPHQLEAPRARVGHSQVADERHESALSVVGAARTDGGGPCIDGRDAQRAARRGTGNHGGTGFVARDGRLTVLAGTPAEEAMIQIRAGVHFRRGW
jgi:hypothetical protein